jgi:hypothetical protein
MLQLHAIRFIVFICEPLAPCEMATADTATCIDTHRTATATATAVDVQGSNEAGG